MKSAVIKKILSGLPGLLLLLAAACQAPSAGVEPEQPVQLRVITSGGFTAAYNVLAPQFEAATGIALITEYGASSGEATTSIPSRLARGESFDVIILADYSMENLIAAGYVSAETRRDLALSKIGMSVRKGAPKPDISTPEAFVQVLRDAGSIGYSASASGTYLSTELFPRLGLWQELEPKATKVIGERVGTLVANGEVEIGFQQVSELLPIEGIDYVGPIPDEYQKVTVFAAGVTTNSTHPAAARVLLDYFGSPEVAATVDETGLNSLATAKE